MEVSSDLELLDVAEAVRCFLQPFDRRLDDSRSRIGGPVQQISQHAEVVAPDPFRHLTPRSQPAMDGAPGPAGKEITSGPTDRHHPIAGRTAP